MKVKNNKYILSLLFLSLCSMPAFSSVEYDAGMNAYNKGQYDFAKTLFQKAIKANSKDVNAKYMYAQILVKERQYEQAKNEYNDIIRISPDSQAAKLSQQGIKLIDDYNKKQNPEKTEVAEKTKLPPPSKEPDYLKNAYRNGKFYTRPKGTTRIYITKSPYKSLAVKAFSEWQSAMGSAVMFTYSGNPQDASVILSFEERIDLPGAEKGGVTSSKFDGDNIVSSNIVIRTVDEKGNKVPDNVIYHVLLHEIGHAIGIMGHSTDPNDIMSTGTSVYLPHLSQRDKNTARALYNTYKKKPDSEAVQKAKVDELENIEKRIPKDPASFIDLGDEYFSAGNFDKALEQYKKAELLVQNKDLYYRIIKVYRELNDKDNEMVYLKKILDKDKSDMSALNNIVYNYAQQRRYQEIYDIVNKFVEDNPDKAKDPKIQEYQKRFSAQRIKQYENIQKFGRM